MTEGRSDTPRVFFPPPLMIGGTLIGGLLLDGRLRSFPAELTAWLWVGTLIATVGLMLIAASLGLFRRVGTRPEPWQPASVLIKSGLYRRTRNPMYLGMLLTYAGVAIGLRSPTAGLLFLPVFLIIDRVVVAREEAYLARKFGADFARYQEKVRRWL